MSDPTTRSRTSNLRPASLSRLREAVETARRAGEPTAQDGVRAMLKASETETASSDSGYRDKARALLTEIRQYDERFPGDSDGIAAALICQAFYEAHLNGVNECREAVKYAFDKAGVPAPGAA